MDKRAYNLEILSPAQSELEEIARVHLALSGPQSAKRVINQIYEAMNQLTYFPLSAPVMPDDVLRTSGFRYILAKPYLLFYRFSADTVIVYHIAHGTTDYPKLFKQTDSE